MAPICSHVWECRIFIQLVLNQRQAFRLQIAGYSVLIRLTLSDPLSRQPINYSQLTQEKKESGLSFTMHHSPTAIHNFIAAAAAATLQN